MSIVHGSCLHYAARKSEKYMRAAREGLEGARSILALSFHSSGTIAEDFPDLEERTSSLPGGVDTDLFRPDALDLRFLENMRGGQGHGPEHDAALREALKRSENTGELADLYARWPPPTTPARTTGTRGPTRGSPRH